MAHELGHLLLGANAHSKWGLMRARWTREDLVAADRGELSFSNSERIRIHNALIARYQAQVPMKAEHAPGGTSSIANNVVPSELRDDGFVPQVVTHEKVLANCEAEFDEFIDRMGLLGEKLGPLLLQVPWFNKYQMQADEFFRRLRFFLQRVKDLPTVRLAVEVRNRAWLDKRLTDLLREYNVALALTDISRMPRPWEKKQFDWVTTDFVYVRWLGDRKGMETLTTTWDKTIINRTEDLQNWAELFRQFVSRNLKVYAYANNHYAGHGPDTVKLFWDMWEKK